MHHAAAVIELLPALPTAWATGSVAGLRARGGITVEEVAWANGAVVAAKLAATVDTTVEARWRDRHGNRRTRRLTLAAGERATLA